MINSSLRADTSRLFDLTGRLALVTGSSKGIGLALARALGGAGATVVLNARDAIRLEASRAELAAAGIDAHARAFDVTDAEAVDATIAKIESEIAPIDILVNNAGMQHRAPFPDFPTDAWQSLFRTNVDSVFLAGRAVSRRMRERRRGKIINVCSVQSELGKR